MRSPSLLLYMRRGDTPVYAPWGYTGDAPWGYTGEAPGPISTYSFIGSQVNTTPRRLNTLRSTSESITVECT